MIFVLSGSQLSEHGVFYQLSLKKDLKLQLNSLQVNTKNAWKKSVLFTRHRVKSVTFVIILITDEESEITQKKSKSWGEQEWLFSVITNIQEPSLPSLFARHVLR